MRKNLPDLWKRTLKSRLHFCSNVSASQLEGRSQSNKMSEFSLPAKKLLTETHNSKLKDENVLDCSFSRQLLLAPPITPNPLVLVDRKWCSIHPNVIPTRPPSHTRKHSSGERVTLPTSHWTEVHRHRWSLGIWVAVSSKRKYTGLCIHVARCLNLQR